MSDHAGRDRAVTVTAPSRPDAPASGSPVRRKFGRRKFDKQPTQTAAVLIASNGETIPGAAIRQALRISGGEPVAVVTIARIYGSSLGLPNPGLMPTRKEMDEQKEIVAARRCRPSRRAGRRPGARSPPRRRPSKTIAAGGRGPGRPARARGPAREGRVASLRRGRRRQGGGQEARRRGHRRGRQPLAVRRPRRAPSSSRHTSGRHKEEQQACTSACSGSASAAPTPTTSSAPSSTTCAIT